MVFRAELREYIDSLPVIDTHEHLENEWNQPDWNVLSDYTRHYFSCDLVSAGLGIALIPDECAEPRQGITYVPLENWHQALYMCILYDKWLEPPVWGFCEQLVKEFRNQPVAENNNWYADI